MGAICFFLFIYNRAGLLQRVTKQSDAQGQSLQPPCPWRDTPQSLGLWVLPQQRGWGTRCQGTWGCHSLPSKPRQSNTSPQSCKSCPGVSPWLFRLLCITAVAEGTREMEKQMLQGSGGEHNAPCPFFPGCLREGKGSEPGQAEALYPHRLPDACALTGAW